MISNLKATKYYFENMFATKWNTTPVHYVGQEFDQDGTNKWVNPFYTPSRSENSGISGLTKNYGSLQVACWAESDVNAMDLADDIITFITDNTGVEYRLFDYVVEDHGFHKTNKVYVIVSFRLEIFEGIC